MEHTVTFDSAGFQKEVGMRLALIRKQRGISQATLAERMGIGRPVLANVELGRQRIYVDQVWRAAIILGVPVTSLIPERA